jgi:hypothetical protein
MRRLSLLFLLLVPPASAAWATGPQQARQIHPPQWAVGFWTNALDSDSRRIVLLQVDYNAIRVTRGVPGPETELLKQYAGWGLKETRTGNDYGIEFRKLNRTELFSLTLYRPDPGSQLSRTATLYMDRAPGANTAEPTPLSVGLLCQMDNHPGVTRKESPPKANQTESR